MRTLTEELGRYAAKISNLPFEVQIVLLFQEQKVSKVLTYTQGHRNRVSVKGDEVRAALKEADGIAFIHNHPDEEEPHPSNADRYAGSWWETRCHEMGKKFYGDWVVTSGRKLLRYR